MMWYSQLSFWIISLSNSFHNFAHKCKMSCHERSIDMRKQKLCVCPTDISKTLLLLLFFSLDNYIKIDNAFVNLRTYTNKNTVKSASRRTSRYMIIQHMNNTIYIYVYKTEERRKTKSNNENSKRKPKNFSMKEILFKSLMWNMNFFRINFWW